MMNKIAFIFPGQGSQEIGMGQALVEAYPAARQIVTQADDILGFPLSELCFNGPEVELNDTINTQIAIFVTSIATWEAMKAAGYTVKPAYLAGHSLGEYTAYVVANVLSFEAAARLVRERGRLMKKAGELNPGGMAAIIKLPDETVSDICQQAMSEGHGPVQVANYNAPEQVVVSGDEAAVERCMTLAKEAGARKVVKLPVSVAPHSALMGVIADEFQQLINDTSLNLPEIPIVANITARPLESLADIRTEMAQQLTASVRWTDSVRYMLQQDVTEFVEIGPKKVLSSLVRRVEKRVQVQTVQTPADVANLLEKHAE